MRLVNIEAGPWGGFILVMALLASAFVLYFASWMISGIVGVAVIALVALVVWIVGKRVMRRLIHGRAR